MGRQTEAVLREMAARTSLCKPQCCVSQSWARPFGMSVPCPDLWPSSPALSCRCALPELPDHTPEQPPPLCLRQGWALQTCFRNGWVVRAGKTF